jgi:hypothetical protein
VVAEAMMSLPHRLLRAHGDDPSTPSASSSSRNARAGPQDVENLHPLDGPYLTDRGYLIAALNQRRRDRRSSLSSRARYLVATRSRLRCESGDVGRGDYGKKGAGQGVEIQHGEVGALGFRRPGVPVNVLSPNPPISGTTAAMIRNVPASPVSFMTSRGARVVRPRAYCAKPSSTMRIPSFIVRGSDLLFLQDQGHGE